MPASAILHPRQSGAPTSLSSRDDNPLPQVLHTPAGLALLEIQGTINIPSRTENQNGDSHGGIPDQTLIGSLVFPGYNSDQSLNTWTKTVHMYVGHHQRLTGEVKKLPKAIAIIRRKSTSSRDEDKTVEETVDQLEIVEIVKYKILFSQRPEPVGTWTGESEG